MSREPSPLFLARRAYAKRRLADGARMLPVVGAGLFVLPLLWKAPPGEEGIGTVGVMVYLFLVWVFLAGAAGIISRRLAEKDETQIPLEKDG